MGITHDAPSNTITVTGYTEGTPCTFEDVYQASQAGGWGVVSKQGTYQYSFAAKVNIGDGSTVTWFIDSAIQVHVEDIFTAMHQNWMSVKANARCRFGALLDAIDHVTHRGIQFALTCAAYHIHLISGGAATEVSLYGCSFMKTVSTARYLALSVGDNHRVWNCLFMDVSHIRYGGAPDIFNCTFLNGSFCLELTTPTSCEQVVAHDCGYVFHNRFVWNSVTIKNVFGRNNSYVGWLWDTVLDSYVIDGDFDAWVFLWSGTNAGRVMRQYTVNLKVVDSAGSPLVGATVTLYDKDNNAVFSVATEAGGVIAEQTVTRGYYAQATGDTLQEYSPHRLVVSMTGCKPVTIEAITMETINWTLALLAWSEVITDELPVAVAVASPSVSVEVAPIAVEVTAS